MVREPEIHSNEYMRFASPDGSAISLNHPLTKAAMLCLCEIWPRRTPLKTLRDQARARLNLESTEDPRTAAEDFSILGKWLLTAYLSLSDRLIELNLSAPRFVVDLSERPVASPLARYQAAGGNRVTNMRHESVPLDELHRQLLLRLDGKRDREALLREIAKLVDDGHLAIQQDGQPVSPQEMKQMIEGDALNRKLADLAKCALLIA
ncbi:MAG: hypothetical protein HY000_22200 [Planctomycetes bacterium]|nr:hypothetical protein [Planctomycetota bacterium]